MDGNPGLFETAANNDEIKEAIFCVISRKKFIQSVGATCDNWSWSWSFVNREEKFVVFGLWDVHPDGLILGAEWKGKSRRQSEAHIRLVSVDGYQLKTFQMERGYTEKGAVTIKSFEPVLTNKYIFQRAGNWYATDDGTENELSLPEEVSTPEQYIEGATKRVSINAYERNPRARLECIEYYGCRCYVCNFDFEEVYGDLGEGYIHVHHEVPLAEVKEAYSVHPISDLKPLCPNCHAMIHKAEKAMSVDDLAKLLKKDN